jgi:glycine oxidase
VNDVLVIGGGVIGLSIAYELARHGDRVQLLERGELAREASWAGAGILPPPATRNDLPAWDRLQSYSYELHRTWAAELRERTGIDNGYRICGGLYLARRAGEAAALRAAAEQWRSDGVEVETLSPGELARLEPGVADVVARDLQRAAYLLPQEAQIRNPRHLQALVAACRQLGVELTDQTSVAQFDVRGGRIASVQTNRGSFMAEKFCVATGAWTEALAAQLGLTLSVYPVRGQMLLYRCAAPPLGHIVSEGPRYLVPRDDGHVLVGSTEEDVGFDKRNTVVALAELRDFATSLVPALADAELVASWAGLRPHAVDGFPYIGDVPHLENAFLAAGHYRAGLSTSPGTAMVMRELLQGQPTSIDISEFRLDR